METIDEEKTLIELFQEFDECQPIPEGFSDEDLVMIINSMGDKTNGR